MKTRNFRYTSSPKENENNDKEVSYHGFVYETVPSNVRFERAHLACPCA